jgi:hypothetical protein
VCRARPLRKRRESGRSIEVPERADRRCETSPEFICSALQVRQHLLAWTWAAALRWPPWRHVDEISEIMKLSDLE